jgi:hypothetical protein
MEKKRRRGRNVEKERTSAGKKVECEKNADHCTEIVVGCIHDYKWNPVFCDRYRSSEVE